MWTDDVLSELDLQRLELDPAVIYALSADLRIAYCNAAWDRFAIENNGEPLMRPSQIGRPVLEVIPSVLVDYYFGRFRQVAGARQPISHVYECSSADVFRYAEMQLASLPRSRGIVVKNLVLLSEPQSSRRSPHPPLPAHYVDGNGAITMCASCRRTERRHSSEWDWVPMFVEFPIERNRDLLCPDCRRLYYGA